MQIWLTGASGFLGRAVSREAAQYGHDIATLTRRPDNQGWVDPIPKDATCIHLAADNIITQTNDNVDSIAVQSQALVDGLLGSDVRRIVFASSAAVYGDRDERPHSETDPTRPRGDYAKAKVAVERLLALAGGHAWARIANVYGPGMSTKNVFSDCFAQLDGDGPIKVRDPNAVRDYIHVSDVARGLLALALSPHIGAMNLGTGVGTSVADLVALLLVVAGRTDRVAPTVKAAGSSLVLDPGLAHRKIGWRAGISLQNGLRELVHGS